MKIDPDNYRPISITSSLAKVFEQILREQMNEYLERNKLLGTMQFGFRAKYSTRMHYYSLGKI